MLKQLSIFVNHHILFGAKEPFCARVYANSVKHGGAWRRTEIVVNRLLWFWKNHCCEEYCEAIHAAIKRHAAIKKKEEDVPLFV